jgi:hypothetical protein
MTYVTSRRDPALNTPNAAELAAQVDRAEPLGHE